MQKSANYLDLFAKKYSEKSNTVKFTLFSELTLSFHPSYVETEKQTPQIILLFRCMSPCCPLNSTGTFKWMSLCILQSNNNSKFK